MRSITIWEGMTVTEFAQQIGCPITRVISMLADRKHFATPQTMLELHQSAELADTFCMGFTVIESEAAGEARQWVDTEYLEAGSRVRVSRPKVEQFVAASSLYRLTPCTQADAVTQQPRVVDVVFRAERPKALAAVESPDDDNVEDDEDDVPC